MSGSPKVLVDLHSHVLPGLDDGARNLDEALAMLRIAERQGTAVLCATPHADRVTPEQVREAVRRLNEVAASEALSVNVAAGSEIALAPDTPERLQRGELLSLNETRYVLVELPLRGPWPSGAEVTLSELALAGFRPVLAHVERYPGVQQSPDLVERLVDLGVLTQINADSLVARSGSARRRTAELLLRRHAIHLLASDSHGARHRPPVLQPALERCGELAGADFAEFIIASAAAVLAGKDVVAPPLRPAPAPAGRWPRLLRGRGG